ncbi:hypothetical protein TNCV_2542521 [Trichonephila clavipes]|nr:hypothetical protein TNCV_2542521 [Trichonephila clavipes]
MEIRTRSSDNSSSYKSINFEGVQPRSKESQYSRKNGYTRAFGDRIRVRGIRVLPAIADHLSDQHPALGQNQIEDQKTVERRIWDLKDRGKRYNLRPRRGSKVESRPSSQAAGVPEAEEVSNSIAMRGQDERTVKNPTPLKN